MVSFRKESVAQFCTCCWGLASRLRDMGNRAAKASSTFVCNDCYTKAPVCGIHGESLSLTANSMKDMIRQVGVASCNRGYEALTTGANTCEHTFTEAGDIFDKQSNVFRQLQFDGRADGAYVTTGSNAVGGHVPTGDSLFGDSGVRSTGGVTGGNASAWASNKSDTTTANIKQENFSGYTSLGGNSSARVTGGLETETAEVAFREYKNSGSVATSTISSQDNSRVLQGVKNAYAAGMIVKQNGAEKNIYLNEADGNKYFIGQASDGSINVYEYDTSKPNNRGNKIGNFTGEGHVIPQSSTSSLDVGSFTSNSSASHDLHEYQGDLYANSTHSDKTSSFSEDMSAVQTYVENQRKTGSAVKFDGSILGDPSLEYAADRGIPIDVLVEKYSGMSGNQGNGYTSQNIPSGNIQSGYSNGFNGSSTPDTMSWSNGSTTDMSSGSSLTMPNGGSMSDVDVMRSYMESCKANGTSVKMDGTILGDIQREYEAMKYIDGKPSAYANQSTSGISTGNLQSGYTQSYGNQGASGMPTGYTQGGFTQGYSGNQNPTFAQQVNSVNQYIYNQQMAGQPVVFDGSVLGDPCQEYAAMRGEPLEDIVQRWSFLNN